MKKAARIKVLLLVCISAGSLFGPRASAVNQRNNEEIIRQARQAYYSLGKLGFVEFQSNVQPNWQVILQREIAANPAGMQERLKLLNGLHFSVSFNQEGNIKVTHTSEVTAPDEARAAAFKQIYAGMEQILNGFFTTWNIFMIKAPLPNAKDEYQLQDLGKHYFLTYRDSGAEASLTMTKDFAITEIKASTAEFTSVIKPYFKSTAQGYILTGYEGNYEFLSTHTKMQLQVQIEYQEVSGLQLPNKLYIDTVNGGTTTKMELLFSDYKVKTR